MERRQAIRPKADEIVSMTVEQIQKKYNVGSRWAYAMKKNASRETIPTTDVAPNQKQAIFEALYRNGQAKNIAELRGWLQKARPDLQPHNLVHVIWAMQKDGHVRFRERKNTPIASEGSLERIRLSPSGVAEGRKRFPAAKIDPSPVIDRTPSVSAQRRENVMNGRDMEQDIVRPARTPVEPPKQNEKSFTGESTPQAEGASMSASTTDKGSVTDTHTQYPNRDEYPLITTLMTRADQITRYMEAAKLLEDDAELAVSILEKVKVTPLEQEVIRFVGALKSRD